MHHLRCISAGNRERERCERELPAPSTHPESRRLKEEAASGASRATGSHTLQISLMHRSAPTPQRERTNEHIPSRHLSLFRSPTPRRPLVVNRIAPFSAAGVLLHSWLAKKNTIRLLLLASDPRKSLSPQLLMTKVHALWLQSGALRNQLDVEWKNLTGSACHHYPWCKRGAGK